MSSAAQTAAKIAHRTYRDAKSAKERWVIKEAYPLYATIGLGCVGAVLYLGRLALGPDTMWDKTRRASSDKDKPEDITRGEAYHNHGLRKFLAGRNTSILPDWKYSARDDDE
ncbi:hypothetical protein WJX82_009449 [Trebouxia sp. C0006]